jgi:zinc protease
MADLQKFFRTYYAPNNQTFVLAGDVSPDEVFALARRYLEPIPRQAAPEPVRVSEPEQSAERRVIVRRSAQTPLLQYAYKAPAAADPRAHALNLLISILVDGDASRLYRELVENRKVIVDLGGHWHEGFDPALFWLYFTLPEGADPDVVQPVIDAELARLAREGVTAEELRRAKSMAAVAFWKKLSTIDGKAQLLGEYEVFHGDWAKLFSAPEELERVTVEDVRAVARDVLDASRRTVGVLIPDPEADGALAEDHAELEEA